MEDTQEMTLTPGEFREAVREGQRSAMEKMVIKLELRRAELRAEAKMAALSFRLPEELKGRLAAQAEERGVPTADLARMILEAGVTDLEGTYVVPSGAGYEVVTIPEGYREEIVQAAGSDVEAGTK
jgi:hypothetical protein